MKTKYSDLIQIRESAIAFKIHPENGNWKDFIPNKQFNDVLENVIKSVYNNNLDFHKSFWIAGTYGSGKSHAAAVIKHLLCDDIEDIRDYVETEYKNISFNLLRSDILNLRKKKRLFPVSLYGIENMSAAEDLPFVLQMRIVEALKEEDIEFEVQTDFDKYVEDIAANDIFWLDIIESDNQLQAIAPTTEILVDKLNKHDISIIRQIKNALRRRNRVIPLQSDNLEKWMFEVQDYLTANTLYDGLLILWDEFTDVLKSAFGNSILVTLQSISERMMMPKNNSYFLFISHPSALDSLQIEEREKTKGRYHYMPYNMETVSAYKIMSRKFILNGEDDSDYKFKRDAFISHYENLYEDFAKMSTSTSPEETKSDLYNLFPLHPGTANLATYYAREAGSSSRSVFEFIGANQAIRDFFNDEQAYAETRVITADFLWDYVVDEFNQKVSKFGAVTERFNSRKLQVENKGKEYYAVFKSILLLNALNNIANNVTVTPSEENIKRLFAGTYIEPKIDEILNYFNDSSIVQKAPGGLFSIQFSSLPTREIEMAKNELQLTEFRYISQIINSNSDVENMLNKNFSQVTRPKVFKMFSIENNEYILLNKIEKGRKDCHSYEIFMALMFARDTNELNELKQIAYKATTNDEERRFDNTVFVIYDTPLGDDNYERFIEYQANAKVAASHNSTEQAATHRESANGVIKEWIQKAQRGTFKYYLRENSDSNTALKIALTINSCVAPTIFSSGPDSYDLLRRSKSATYWRKQSAEKTVTTVLTNNTKTDISGHCTGQYLHMTLLLQDSVDENLKWKPDIDPQHPLKQVSDFIDKKLQSVNKNTDFNLGEKLKELTMPPFGLFKSCACMGMVAFAMRKYVKQIFNTNGKPLDATHIADAVIMMFKAWEDEKINNKLDFMFETKEAGELCKLFIQNFHLNELRGYNDISSLTDARWALTHEYIENKGYPLWSLKYSSEDEYLNKLIDDIVKISTDKDFRNPHLLAETLSLMKQMKFELTELLKQPESFRKGFINFILSVKGISLEHDEINNAISGLKKHVQSDIGYWTEDEVSDAVKTWRLYDLNEKQQLREDGRGSEEQLHHFIGTGSDLSNNLVDPNKISEEKNYAFNKIQNIQNLTNAKDLLRQILEITNDRDIINIINKFNA